jgi:hypothetical protein
MRKRTSVTMIERAIAFSAAVTFEQVLFAQSYPASGDLRLVCIRRLLVTGNRTAQHHHGNDGAVVPLTLTLMLMGRLEQWRVRLY